MSHHFNEHQMFTFQMLVVLLGLFAIFLYLIAVRTSNQRYAEWRLSRTLLWISGVILAELSLVGALPARAHVDFSYHMAGHLLLGMLAPLLMVLSDPILLFFRSLPVRFARRFTSILKSWPMRVLGDPYVASIVNVGGLWILYKTELYLLMHHHFYLYVFIHIHVFLAGYLFTMSMISIAPTFHRTGFLYRGIALLLALAAHGILSKYIYTYPPVGVPQIQAELGGLLMYYGGDLIDLFLIILFFSQWYKASRPRRISGFVDGIANR